MYRFYLYKTIVHYNKDYDTDVLSVNVNLMMVRDHLPLQQGLKLYRYIWYSISCFFLLITSNHLESVKSQKY